MPFLERETLSRYADVGFECQCDLSWVNYCMTANDDTKLPAPLRDRVRVIKVPAPGPAHLAALTTSIMKDLAVEMNQPAAFLMPLAPDELAVVAKVWGDNGSLRSCRRSCR